jgi:hypothetical protein
MNDVTLTSLQQSSLSVLIFDQGGSAKEDEQLDKGNDREH